MSKSRELAHFQWILITADLRDIFKGENVNPTLQLSKTYDKMNTFKGVSNKVYNYFAFFLFTH